METEISEELFWKPVIIKAEGRLPNEIYWYSGMNNDKALKLAHVYLDERSQLSKRQKLKAMTNRFDAFYRTAKGDWSSNQLKHGGSLLGEEMFTALYEFYGNCQALDFYKWRDGCYGVIRAKNMLRISGLNEEEADLFNSSFDKSIQDILQIRKVKYQPYPKHIKRLANGYLFYIQKINEAFPPI